MKDIIQNPLTIFFTISIAVISALLILADIDYLKTIGG